MEWYEELIAKLGATPDREFGFKDLIKVSVAVEAHESGTHMKYSRIAEEEGRTEIAEMFKELATGEDYFYDELSEKVKELTV